MRNFARECGFGSLFQRLIGNFNAECGNAIFELQRLDHTVNRRTAVPSVESDAFTAHAVANEFTDRPGDVGVGQGLAVALIEPYTQNTEARRRLPAEHICGE